MGENRKRPREKIPRQKNVAKPIEHGNKGRGNPSIQRSKRNRKRIDGDDSWKLQKCRKKRRRKRHRMFNVDVETVKG